MYQARAKVYRRRRRHHKERHTTFGGVLLGIIVWIPAVAIVISYLSIYVNPQTFWVPMFFGLYFIPIFIINFLLFLILLVRRKALLLVPLVSLLPSLVYADRFVKTGKEVQTFDGNPVKVTSYNVGRYSAGRDMTADEAAEGIRLFISQNNPDIVCLQEFMVADSTLMDEILPEYPYRSAHLFKGSNYFGNVTLSRHPIVGNRKITFSRSTNLCIVSDVRIGDRTVRVFNCHLESYALSFISVLKRLSDRERFTEELAQIHYHIKQATVRRADQVATVMDCITESEFPSIICGDFNDTPVSYAYHQLQKHKTDSFVAAGKGFGSTYSLMWPLLRIDYILLPSEFGCSMHEVDRLRYSDHYPVTTDVYMQ